MIRTTIRLTFVLSGLILSTALAFGQFVTREYQLREVRKLSVHGTQLPKKLAALDNDGGVIGIHWSCDPSAVNGRVTPSLILLSAPKSVALNEAFEVEIAIVNLCDTPIDVPVSPGFVAPQTKDPQYISIVKLELASEDERFDFDGHEFLFGATDQPSTVQRLMRNEYVNVRMSVKATSKRGTVSESRSFPQTVSVSPYLRYWERNSDRMKGGIWGPFSAATMGGTWKDITIAAASAGVQTKPSN